MTGVFLGYEDEIITDQIDLSYLINKIGGIPNWPITGLEFDSKCVVCGFPRPLVLQCYAPLLESSYHRTLYVFGCINSSCWNNSNSWSCYRSQHIDKSYDSNSIKPKDEKLKATVASDPWCSGADEWGDDEGIADSPTTEVFSDPSFQHQTTNNIDRMSDSDEEESNEMEQIESSVNKISLSNNSESGVSSESNTGATAQIDGNESEVITDLPTMPDNNIFALLTQVPELPEALIGDNVSIQFDAKYVNVYEEYLEEGKSDHVKQLLDQYEKEHSEDLKKVKVKGKSSKKSEVEEYEKAIPLHGNEVFHNFLTRIQMNPTQILRYCFGGQPLPMSPLPASLRSSKCRHCGGDNWFELQILPTIIPSLRIPNSTSAHLEFGTVLIYTCKKSCWRNNDKILEETIFVQSEPS